MWRDTMYKINFKILLNLNHGFFLFERSEKLRLNNNVSSGDDDDV